MHGLLIHGAMENNNLYINLYIHLACQSPTLIEYVPQRGLTEPFFIQQFLLLVPNPYSMCNVMCEYRSSAETSQCSLNYCTPKLQFPLCTSGCFYKGNKSHTVHLTKVPGLGWLLHDDRVNRRWLSVFGTQSHPQSKPDSGGSVFWTS